jgi:hypothetical protein
MAPFPRGERRLMIAATSKRAPISRMSLRSAPAKSSGLGNTGKETSDPMIAPLGKSRALASYLILISL